MYIDLDKAEINELKEGKLFFGFEVGMLCDAVFQDIVNNLEDGSLPDDLARKNALDIIIYFRPKILEYLSKV